MAGVFAVPAFSDDPHGDREHKERIEIHAKNQAQFRQQMEKHMRQLNEQRERHQREGRKQQAEMLERQIDQMKRSMEMAAKHGPKGQFEFNSEQKQRREHHGEGPHREHGNHDRRGLEPSKGHNEMERLEQRVEHLSIAHEHLKAGGFHQEAEHLARLKNDIIRELEHLAHQRPGGNEAERMMHQMEEMRQQMEELKRANRQLQEQFEIMKKHDGEVRKPRAPGRPGSREGGPEGRGKRRGEE